MGRSRTAKADAVSVKSSLRTLEILEYCDAVRRPVTVSELVTRLAYPQSSASTLVQSLLNHGYLSRGPDGRGVVPSGRVSALGRWVEPTPSRAEIRVLMEEVAAETGQTVLLGIPSGLCVRYIDTVAGRLRMRLEIATGDRLPLVRSGIGMMLLSLMSDTEIADLLAATRERVEAEGPTGVGATDLADLWNEAPNLPTLDELMTGIRTVRNRGYSLSLGQVTLGAGIISVALRSAAGETPMAIGVGGLSPLIERDELAIVDVLRQAIARRGLTADRDR